MCSKIWNFISDLENLDPLASIGASAVIIITAIIGVRQYNIWKDQRRFEIEFETAFRIMKVAHKAQILLDRIQTIEPSNDEYTNVVDSIQQKGITDVEIIKNDHVARAQILIDRLKGIMNCHEEILDILHEAKSLFGESNLHTIMYDLSECFNELYGIEESVIINIDRGLDHDEKKRVNEVNKLNRKIDSIVNSIEEVILPIIRYKKYKKKS